MSWPTPIRIVGVGSPHGDDALGWEAIRLLRERIPSTAAVEFHLIDGGQRLLDLLDGQGSLFLVDAVSSGSPPGLLHRIDWADRCVETLSPGCTHDLRPAESLRLAAALGMLPSHVTLYGIEVGTLEPCAELSPSVAAAVAELVRRIEEEVTGVHS
jgi:hydrogenase maturation protease